MPQCMAFDYFSIHCKKQSISNDNSTWGCAVALGSQGKQVPNSLREFLNPKKYTNH